MEIRKYDPKNDEKSVLRIFREVGWLTSKEEEPGIKIYLNGSRALIADINGEAECFAGTMPGVIKYLREDLPFTAVTGVATSRIARKQGLAAKLTAKVIARDAAAGALVVGLGIFEQGFYDRLGFGSGVYEQRFSFDPSLLNVNCSFRPPKRIEPEDYKQVQQALVNRRRGHGSINILQDNSIHAELIWIKGSFGLGYYDGPNGELTHFLWIKGSGESGPYDIPVYAFRTGDQYLELLALLKSFGDQVRLVTMREPAGIQFQDLIEQPFKLRQMTAKSKYENRCRSSSYYQVRICNLEECLARTKLPHGSIRFNLEVSDSISAYLDKSDPWQGIGGEYVVSLGQESAAVPGKDSGLPTLQASIGAFTRLWLGVRPATGLMITDDLAGPEELLRKLDVLLQLPEPKPEWDF